MSTIVVRGAGSIGIRHAEIAAREGHAVSLWPVRARAAETPSAVDVISGYNDLDASPDLVIVATDTGRHIADVAEALDAGAATVLAEKPLCPSVDDARPLVLHPRAWAVVVAAPLRFRPGMATISEFARNRRLRTARVVCQSWLPDWRPGRDFATGYAADPDTGGVMRDLIHEIDYAQYLFGRPEAVAAVLATPGPETVLGLNSEESADLLWRMVDGAVISFRLDYITRPPVRRVDAQFDDASIKWDLLTGKIKSWTVADGAQDLSEDSAALQRDAAMTAQLRSILAGDAASPDAIAGQDAVLLCDVARDAASKQSWITVPNSDLAGALEGNGA